MATETYFWIKPKGNFGKSVKFGDEMPPLDSEMKKYLLSKSWIDTKKPESFNSSQASAFLKAKELNVDLMKQNTSLDKKNIVLVGENKGLIVENIDLKNQVVDIEKLMSANLTLSAKVVELEDELEDIPKNVRTANQKIKKLEKDLADATEPGDK